MIAMFKILCKKPLKLQCWVTGNTFGRLLALYSSRNPQGLHTQCTFALDLQPTELTQMSTTQYPSHSVVFQNPEPWLLLLAVLQVIPMDSWAIYVWVGCQQRGSEAKKRSKPKSARDFFKQWSHYKSLGWLLTHKNMLQVRILTRFFTRNSEMPGCQVSLLRCLPLPARRSRENHGETCTFFCTRLIGQGQWQRSPTQKEPLKILNQSILNEITEILLSQVHSSIPHFEQLWPLSFVVPSCSQHVAAQEPKAFGFAQSCPDIVHKSHMGSPWLWCSIHIRLLMEENLVSNLKW